MKTCISLPDNVLEAANALAKRLRISRSRLVCAALSEYVAKHNYTRVTERLTEVYAAEDGSLDGFMREAARRTLKRSDWVLDL